MASSSHSGRRSFEAKLLQGWIVVCWIVGAALCVAQLLEIPVRSALRGYDNTFNYVWLRSAMVDRDWDFRNDLIECNTLVPEQRASALALPLTATGQVPNKYGIGWSLLSAPFYVVADVIVRIGRGLGFWSLSNDGFNPVYQIVIQLGHCGLSVVGLILAFRTISSWLSAAPALGRLSAAGTEVAGSKPVGLNDSPRAAALFGIASVWAASPLIYYQSANVSMSHGAAFFAVSLMAYAFVRASAEPALRRWWVLSGFALGLAVIVRYQLVLFALPLVWTWWRTHRGRASFSAGARWWLLGAVPPLLLQVIAWRSVYGEWLVFSYGVEGETFHWGKPALWDSLFSSWHGLLYWHPFLALAVVGVIAWLRRDAAVAGGWIGAIVLIGYANAAWWCWWFASSFGNRGYDAAMLVLMMGAAVLFQRCSVGGRRALILVAVLAGSWNFYVVLLYRTGAISRQDPVTWGQMIEARSRLGEAAHF